MSLWDGNSRRLRLSGLPGTFSPGLPEEDSDEGAAQVADNIQGRRATIVGVDLIEFDRAGEEYAPKEGSDKGRPVVRIPVSEEEKGEGDVESDVHNNVQPELK